MREFTINDDASESTPNGDGDDAARREVDRESVREVLDLMRAAVLADGGDIELVDVRPDGVVTVRFHGACVGCPSSSMTLQSGIKRNLRQHVPGVTRVVAVE